MKYSFFDSVIICVLLAFSLFGFVQACSSNGPIGPGTPGAAAHNKAPTASFEVIGDTEGPTPFTVTLDGTSSSDPNGDQLTFLWHFSDGITMEGPVVEHEFESSGRWSVQLVVTDPYGEIHAAEPMYLYSWGLANSAWPKFAHDEQNTCYTENVGPMLNHELADEGGAWARYWRGGVQNDVIRGISIGYDGNVFYTQGVWLRARTASGSFIWDWHAGSKISSWPTILHDGSIVIGTKTGWVHRISEDGDLIWSTRVSAEFWETVNLNSAVNVDGNGHIYIGGYLALFSGPMETRGRLIALDLEGTILWTRIIPHGKWFVAGSAYTDEDNVFADVVMAPALTTSGNIVINGHGGRIFTPDGQLVNEMSYIPDSYGAEEAPFGPPSIRDDGRILFPGLMFHPDGTLNRSMSSYSIYAGWNQAVAIGPDRFDVVCKSYKNFTSLVTRTNEGDICTTALPMGRIPWLRLFDAGVAIDGLGRSYTTTKGLHAIGPPESYSVSPYIRRYSLWSYHRPTNLMTAPVIGENGWLYLGYAKDIMAVGD